MAMLSVSPSWIYFDWLGVENVQVNKRVFPDCNNNICPAIRKCFLYNMIYIKK